MIEVEQKSKPCAAQIATIKHTVMSRKEVHPRKYVHPFSLNEVVVKGAFLSKVRPPIYAAVHGVMLSKKHQSSRSSKKAGMHHWCYCICKSMTKRGIAETLHV